MVEQQGRLIVSEKKVNDLALASYLSLKHPLLRIEPSSGGRSYFVFADTPELEADRMAYLSRRATVEPITFHQQMMSLKASTK